MFVVVLGGAGELGSHFASLCLDKGYDVRIVDITRFHEAWRLKELGIDDRVEYIWKSTFDLQREDIEDSWLILDAAAQPDRPMGTTSPVHTLMNNLTGPIRLLECVRRSDERPILLYPSSCNIFLGVPLEEQPLTESTPPKPINIYGWSKLAAEELYRTYWRCFNIPVIIIRTGSCYGPMGRTDQFIHRCILHMLKEKPFRVRSPKASRTYTFAGDVLEFYDRLVDRLEDAWLDVDGTELIGLTIHNGGNAENRPYETIEVARLIKELTGSNAELYDGIYEAGEVLPDGRPVVQFESSEFAYELLGWKPRHTLKQGLKKTIAWYEENLERYV
ncbi:MAG: NAD-dependent epimerase/dehydratase family protein [Methermicoccaceae archaeon]